MIENGSNPENNPAELFPANFSYWQDFAIASLYDLVLLSLGIEPTLIHELYELRDESDEGEKLSFGLLQAEFDRRLAVINNIVAASGIKMLDAGTGTGQFPTKRYGIKDFIHWAISADWHLPEEFAAYVVATPSTTGTSRPSSERTRREIKKAETQLRYACWQNKADELWAINPQLGISDVALKLESDSNIPTPYKRDVHTIRKHIKKPNNAS